MAYSRSVLGTLSPCLHYVVMLHIEMKLHRIKQLKYLTTPKCHWRSTSVRILTPLLFSRESKWEKKHLKTSTSSPFENLFRSFIFFLFPHIGRFSFYIRNSQVENTTVIKFDLGMGICFYMLCME